MQRALHAIIRGRVQMVLYRDFASRTARDLALTGTARNLDDGTVEVIAEGDENALFQYIEKLKKGPTLARVENIEVAWRQPQKTFSDFKILYSN